LLSAVTVIFLVNLRKTKAKQRLGKRAILPEAPCPGKPSCGGRMPPVNESAIVSI
jgi:hypothetical protein